MRTSPQRSSLALTVALLMACGGSDNTGPNGSGGTGTGGNNGGSNNSASCTITLSGAETGSPTCSDLSAVWTSDNNKSSFGFAGAAGADSLVVAIGFPGEPAVTTYDENSGAGGYVQLDNGTMLWSSPGGSWSLTISSVNTTSSGAGLKGYEVHGALTATLLPAVTSTTVGSVTLNATF
jgi:hypothetical protein